MAAIHEDHHSVAAADDSLHRCGLHDRVDAVVRRTVPVQQQHQRWRQRSVPDADALPLPARLAVQPPRLCRSRGVDDAGNHRRPRPYQCGLDQPAGAERLEAMATVEQTIRTAPARRSRRRSRAGRQLTAGPFTYIVLTIVTVISVFPLYYTMVIGSHTNAEMAQTPPPFT